MELFSNYGCEFGLWETGSRRWPRWNSPTRLCVFSRLCHWKAMAQSDEQLPPSTQELSHFLKLPPSSSSARDVFTKLLWAFCGEWSQLRKRETIISPRKEVWRAQQGPFEIPLGNQVLLAILINAMDWFTLLTLGHGGIAYGNSRSPKLGALWHCVSVGNQGLWALSVFLSRAVEQGSARCIIIFYS